MAISFALEKPRLLGDVSATTVVVSSVDSLSTRLLRICLTHSFNDDSEAFVAWSSRRWRVLRGQRFKGISNQLGRLIGY